MRKNPLPIASKPSTLHNATNKIRLQLYLLANPVKRTDLGAIRKNPVLGRALDPRALFRTVFAINIYCQEIGDAAEQNGKPEIAKIFVIHEPAP
jgi:hypothetical protein